MGANSDKKEFDEAWDKLSWPIKLFIAFVFAAICIGVTMLLMPA